MRSSVLKMNNRTAERCGITAPGLRLFTEHIRRYVLGLLNPTPLSSPPQSGWVFSGDLINQAVILAGGKGERLRPLTDDRPKPMILVNGRPFLEYLILRLKNNGIKEIVVLLGYLSERVVEYFGDGSRFGVKINYHIGTSDNESGTRIRNAAHLFNEKFFLLACDIYWPFNLRKIIDAYKRLGKLGIMAVYNNKKKDGEYGKKSNILVSPDGRVLHHGELVEDPRINGLDLWCFIFDKSVITMMSKDEFSLPGDFLPILIKKNELAAFLTDEKYCTITDRGFLKKAEVFLKRSI